MSVYYSIFYYSIIKSTFWKKKNLNYFTTEGYFQEYGEEVFFSVFLKNKVIPPYYLYLIFPLIHMKRQIALKNELALLHRS